MSSYNGKSTGAGAIGIWMHHLKATSVIDYKGQGYNGKAIKMGAGAQAFDVNAAARSAGLVAISGNCDSVGFAGGYSQGGGHSTLSSKFGLGADQALEWEVIDGRGNIVTANQQSYRDLYWALSGGGGSSYGVVWSLTTRAYPDTYTTGANLTFTSVNITQDVFFEAVGAFDSILPNLVDAGATNVMVLTDGFFLASLTGFQIHESQMTNMLQPFISRLEQLGINYLTSSHEFQTWSAYFDSIDSPCAVGTAQYGGWLIPRSVVTGNNAGLTAAYRSIVSDGGTIVGFGTKATPPFQVNNAVLPAWRNVLIDTVISTPWHFTAPWADMIALQRKMTQVYVPKLSALAPSSGVYLNEADPFQPNWQNAFYGANYQRLRGIKSLYDPDDIFYALGAVGSESWATKVDGRLCKT